MRDRQLLAVIGLMFGLAVGVMTTIPAVALSVASGGLGHGTYSLACLLYPYPMLIWLSQGGAFSHPLIAMALAQFPLYGAIIGAASPWRRARILTACSILVIHLVAAGACLGGLIWNSS